MRSWFRSPGEKTTWTGCFWKPVVNQWDGQLPNYLPIPSTGEFIAGFSGWNHQHVSTKNIYPKMLFRMVGYDF